MSQNRHTAIEAPLDRPLRPPEGPERPIFAFSREMARGDVIDWHRHDHGQIIYSASGLMRLETSAGAWIVPPARAVWIPPGIDHQVIAEAEVAMRAVYVLPEAVPDMPDHCRVLSVSPLLRELVGAALGFDEDYPLDGPEARVVAVLLDQLAAEPEEALHLPIPDDRRLRAVTDALLADPSDPRTLDDFANEAGGSARTLARRFAAETGLSFGAWRQQLRLHGALSRLAQGEPVTSVAFEVGYDSPSAFIAMFRKALGTTPGQYLGRSGPVADPP